METNDALVGIYCKLEIYIIRFCLIIQLARWTCGECDKHTIDLESVNRAILLAEYFRTTAVKVQTAVSQEFPGRSICFSRQIQASRKEYGL